MWVFVAVLANMLLGIHVTKSIIILIKVVFRSLNKWEQNLGHYSHWISEVPGFTGRSFNIILPPPGDPAEVDQAAGCVEIDNRWLPCTPGLFLLQLKLFGHPRCPSTMARHLPFHPVSLVVVKLTCWETPSPGPQPSSSLLRRPRLL